MKNIKSFFFLIATVALISPVNAQNDSGRATPEVEWYPPEIEKSRFPDRALVIISGRTQPSSVIKIDGDSINVITEKATSTSNEMAPPPEVQRQLRANCKAYEMPDIKSKVMASLSKGDKIQTMEHSESWVKVFLPKGSGFMSQPCFIAYKKRTNSPPAALPPPSAPPKIESREAKANGEGFFEIAMDLPQGMNQVPVQVISPSRTEKTFMITIDVSIQKNNIKTNQQISKKKPPAASKKYRFWAGAGFTHQSYSQSTSGAADLSFSTIQAPGLMVRGGYWGDSWGLDFYFRDAPGKIEAEAPFQVESGSYHWRTLEAKGLYQFERGPSSRLMGLPAQWQLRFGAQMHSVPFLDIDGTNAVTVKDHGVTTATLGGGLLLAQERTISYEFALGLQFPVASSGYTISSPMAYEAQIGAAYKFAPNWRVGLFSYTQSLSLSYEFDSNGVIKSGKQNLFYSTFDLRLGYEF